MAKRGLDISKTANLIQNQLEQAEAYSKERQEKEQRKKAKPNIGVVDGGKKSAEKRPPKPAPLVAKNNNDRWTAPSFKIRESKAKQIDRMFLLMKADGVGHQYKQELVDEALDWLVEKYRQYLKR